MLCPAVAPAVSGAGACGTLPCRQQPPAAAQNDNKKESDMCMAHGKRHTESDLVACRAGFRCAYGRGCRLSTEEEVAFSIPQVAPAVTVAASTHKAAEP